MLCFGISSERGVTSENRITILNSEKFSFGTKYYVFASQVKQAFNVEDPHIQIGMMLHQFL